MAKALSESVARRMRDAVRSSEAARRDFGGPTFARRVPASPGTFYARITGSQPDYPDGQPTAIRYWKHGWIEVEPLEYDSGGLHNYVWQDKSGGRKGTLADDPDGEKDPAYVLSSVYRTYSVAQGSPYLSKGPIATGSVVVIEEAQSSGGGVYLIHDYSPEVLCDTYHSGAGKGTVVPTSGTPVTLPLVTTSYAINAVGFIISAGTIAIYVPGLYEMHYSAIFEPTTNNACHEGVAYLEMAKNVPPPFSGITYTQVPIKNPQQDTYVPYTCGIFSSDSVSHRYYGHVDFSYLIPITEDDLTMGETIVSMRIMAKWISGPTCRARQGSLTMQRISHQGPSLNSMLARWDI